MSLLISLTKSSTAVIEETFSLETSAQQWESLLSDNGGDEAAAANSLRSEKRAIASEVTVKEIVDVSWESVTATVLVDSLADTASSADNASPAHKLLEMLETLQPCRINGRIFEDYHLEDPELVFDEGTDSDEVVINLGEFTDGCGEQFDYNILVSDIRAAEPVGTASWKAGNHILQFVRVIG